jgi:hypothetical protein
VLICRGRAGIPTREPWPGRSRHSRRPTPAPSPCAYGKHVKLKSAGVPANKVDSLDVKAWAASVTRNGLSATVVNRAVGILAGILDDAVEHQAVAFNGMSV